MASRIQRTAGKYEWSWTQAFGSGLFLIKCNACKVLVRRIDVQESEAPTVAQRLMAEHICRPIRGGHGSQR